MENGQNYSQNCLYNTNKFLSVYNLVKVAAWQSSNIGCFFCCLFLESHQFILPSEKAKAYFMKYEAVKHQGKRGKGNSLDEVGETAGESAKTVQRYIYLAHLSDALLDMVDKKKIGIVQGVELSFLTEQQQEWVQVVLEETGMIISTVQASRLKEHGKSDELTLPMVRLILTEPKPIERKVTIKADKISRYFPEDYSNEQIENVIYQLLDKWNSSNSEK